MAEEGAEWVLFFDLGLGGMADDLQRRSLPSRCVVRARAAGRQARESRFEVVERWALVYDECGTGSGSSGVVGGLFNGCSTACRESCVHCISSLLPSSSCSIYSGNRLHFLPPSKAKQSKRAMRLDRLRRISPASISIPQSSFRISTPDHTPSSNNPISDLVPIPARQPPPQRNLPNLIPAQNLPHTITLLLSAHRRNLNIDHDERLLDLRAHAIDGVEPVPCPFGLNFLLPWVSFPGFVFVGGENDNCKLGVGEGWAAVVEDC